MSYIYEIGLNLSDIYRAGKKTRPPRLSLGGDREGLETTTVRLRIASS